MPSRSMRRSYLGAVISSAKGRGGIVGAAPAREARLTGAERAIPRGTSNVRLNRPTAPPGYLLSYCWCDTETVAVTPEDVRNGRTVSCGRECCKAP